MTLPTGGAFAAYVFGVGATEMLGVLSRRDLVDIPHHRHGVRRRARARQKDMMHFLIGRFGLDGGHYEAVEYRGAAIRRLPMQERMTSAT